jgi:hypothetical protein
VILHDARATLRLARRLPAFLRRSPTLDECRSTVTNGVRDRESAFRRTVAAAYADPGGPYARLLRHHGVERGDVHSLLADHGIEGALERLYDAGVRITEEELKGRVPIVRPGLELQASAHDFDNPLAAGDYVTRSGGSGGSARSAYGDLAQLSHEAAYLALALEGSGLWERPFAIWRPVPPGVAGLNDVLRHAHLGRVVRRWFSQSPVDPRRTASRHGAFTSLVLAESRALGKRLPRPEHVPFARAGLVARWLAERCDAGTPAFFNTTASGGVRLCAAAGEAGLDLTGTVLRLGGEPFTPAKRDVISGAGCTAVVNYAIAEVGQIAVGCHDGLTGDDAHVLADKVALIGRPRRVLSGSAEVQALVCTSLLPSSPKLLLNVETGDHGRLEHRHCACPLGRLPLHGHVDTIRSHEKLTSEGMRFSATDLLHLMDDVLPSRFGGAPSDYQLVERERAGMTEVDLVASPRLGPLAEREVIETFIAALGADAGREMMAGLWEEGGTVRLVRREPQATETGKILPLQVVEAAAAR